MPRWYNSICRRANQQVLTTPPILQSLIAKLYLIDFQCSVILQSLIAKLMKYQDLTAIICSSEGKTLFLNLIGDIQGRCGDTYANYESQSPYD